MKFEDATKLVKERGPSKYRGVKLTLLEKLTNGLYEKSDHKAIETRTKTKKIATVKGWVGGVTDRQLRRAFKDIDELEVISRDNGTLTYRMRFDTLQGVQKAIDLAKKQTEESNAARAAKARVQRAAQRTLIAELVRRKHEDEHLSLMNVFEIVQYGARLFELAVAV